MKRTCIALVAVLCTSSEKWVFVKKIKVDKNASFGWVKHYRGLFDSEGCFVSEAIKRKIQSRQTHLPC